MVPSMFAVRLKKLRFVSATTIALNNCILDAKKPLSTLYTISFSLATSSHAKACTRKTAEQTFIMKVALLFFLCSGASAFTASKSRATWATSLNVVTTPDNLDSWLEKPLHRRVSTTPVADRKVTKFERMMMPDVVIPPSYSLTWAVALLGPLIMWYHPCKF
jgi:hypothetical protein